MCRDGFVDDAELDKVREFPSRLQTRRHQVFISTCPEHIWTPSAACATGNSVWSMTCTTTTLRRQRIRTVRCVRLGSRTTSLVTRYAPTLVQDFQSFVTVS